MIVADFEVKIVLWILLLLQKFLSKVFLYLWALEIGDWISRSENCTRRLQIVTWDGFQALRCGFRDLNERRWAKVFAPDS